MGTYIFTGKVLPERAAVSVTTPLQLKVQAKDADVEFKATISIAVSQVSVVVKTSEETVDIGTLRNYVEHFVRSVIDAYGYISGRGYDIETTSVIKQDGSQIVFGVEVAELEATQGERPVSFHDLCGPDGLVYRSEHLRRALADLREAIRSPLDTGFFCFRAIEGIRQSFIEDEDGTDTKPSWDRLREALRIDRSWFKEIEEFALPQRHGQMPFMSGERRVSVMRRAWKVIDRFCVYVHREFQRLQENEFELLKD